MAAWILFEVLHMMRWSPLRKAFTEHSQTPMIGSCRFDWLERATRQPSHHPSHWETMFSGLLRSVELSVLDGCDVLGIQTCNLRMIRWLLFPLRCYLTSLVASDDEHLWNLTWWGMMLIYGTLALSCKLYNWCDGLELHMLSLCPCRFPPSSLVWVHAFWMDYSDLPLGASMNECVFVVSCFRLASHPECILTSRPVFPRWALDPPRLWSGWSSYWGWMKE